MNAVISGQSGVAVLVDGSRLASIHAGSDAPPVDRSPGEVRFLLGDARDLEFLENVAPEEARRRLEASTSYYDALHLALILLDGELAHGTRRTAAEELDELLAEDGILSFVESVLHAHPLPRGGDLVGARSACTGSTQRALEFLKKLGALQTAIREVYEAWQAMADSNFDTMEDRQHALSLAVREGLFRDLVATRKLEAAVNGFLLSAVQNHSLQQIDNYQRILLNWVAEYQAQHEEHSVRKSEISNVAEAVSARIAARQVVGGNVVGQREPVDEMLRRLRPKLKQILGRYHIPTPDAEDLVQEALISTIQKWDTILDPEDWLLRTLRNRCVVYWRKRRNTLYNSVDTAILELLSEPVAAPEERGELLRDLGNLLKQLPPRCRELLRLRYGLGYDSAEVAEKMGYHPSGVRKAVRRCMAGLTYQMFTHGFSRDDS